MEQITNSIMMIKPVGFRYNEQTAVNNYYQKVLDDLTPDKIQENALREFNVLVEKLQSIGLNIVVIEDDKESDTPDSIFPNNWVSFHNDGMVGLYPMCAENRRDERRGDILDTLVDEYGFAIEGIKDFTEFEDYDKFLEGTGSMVLDRENKICYAAISIRTDEIAVMQFCEEFGYRPVSFTANQDVDGERMAIYHTNVMMCIGDTFAVICLDTIDNAIERENVIENLEETEKEIIEITEAQKHRFAGNMLQVMGDRSYVVMSSSAYSSLTAEQRNTIEKYSPILYSSLDTIEACGGGSAR
ncbi:MAG: amidinotransferase, partial [Pelagibacterales bacterium]|nr:amidinotransferase [Pelagibacterales bacterium]